MTLSSSDVADLIEVSVYAGADIMLAQGGGGNASVKDYQGTTLGIKASGFCLSEVSDQLGWVEVSIEKINKGFNEANLEKFPGRQAHELSIQIIHNAVLKDKFRPSLETSFHAWLPDRLILHTHSVWANCFACMNNGKDVLGKFLNTAWVDYHTPGYLLGKAVAAAHAATGSKSFLLENHGWITMGENPEEVISLHETIKGIAEKIFGPTPKRLEVTPPSRSMVCWANELEHSIQAKGQKIIARPASRDLLRERAGECPSRGALVPDDVVYGIHAIERVPSGLSASDWIRGHQWDGGGMKIFWLEGNGFILAGPTEKSIKIIEENLLTNVILHQIISPIGLVKKLPNEEILYLSTMESEKYRQKVASGKIR